MASRDLLPKLLFVAACLFFVFLWGFVASHFGWWPAGFLGRALDQAVAVGGEIEVDLHHIHPARHDLQGVATRGESVGGGPMLTTSYWQDDDWQPGVRLIAADGEVLHAWNANPLRIWPDNPYQDSLRGAFHRASNYVHGVHLFDNGDVLLNIEYLGLARLDAAGEVVWRLDRRTHHSVSRNERGNFWVSAARWIEDPAEALQRFPGLVPAVAEDLALEVTPDGEVLREVSVLEAVFRNPELKRLIWRVSHTRSSDLLHLNDVEELSSQLAGDFPDFVAGDLVASLRYVDLVFVFDPDTLEVKWWQSGPWCGQHDPDFQPGGWISIFDNNLDGTELGLILGGSRLWRVRPHSGEREQLYPRGVAGERRFYTMMGGKAQALADGHWLLTEAQYGRVFEIDAAGTTVWEWGQDRHDDGATISEVLEGTRYDVPLETVRSWPKN